jgi:hypothetical protein
MGRVPVCIACGNRRTFWVKKEDENMVANAWDIGLDDTIVACGRCRSRNSVLFDCSDI